MSDNNNKKAPIRLIKDGRYTWDEVAFGYTRLRGIAAPITLAVLTATGAPWWTEYVSSIYTNKNTIEIGNLAYYFSIFILLSVGLTLTSGLMYLRKRAIRSLNVKYYSHQISHKARDIHTDLKKAPNSVQLKVATEQLCSLIQQLFKELIPNKDIQVITRLISEEKGKPVYKTMTRTTGLNPARQNYSEPIPADKGLAAYLQDKSSGKGVLFCTNLEEAVNSNILVGDKNIRKFPNEIREFMAVGLNAWDGEKESMLGLLYITSNQKGTIDVKQMDQFCYVADVLAKLISSIILEKMNEGE